MSEGGLSKCMRLPLVIPTCCLMLFDTYYSCACSEARHEVAVFLGKGFERDATDWSTLRRVDDKKGGTAGAGGRGGGILGAAQSASLGSSSLGSFGAATAATSGVSFESSKLPSTAQPTMSSAPFTMSFAGRGSVWPGQAFGGTVAAPAAVAPAAAAAVGGAGGGVSSRKDSSKATASVASGESASDLLKVLIVEDSLPIMKAMTMNLRRAKHTVDQAVNGLIGLECMKQKEFDVVVMDLQVSVSVDGDGGGLLCALVCRRYKCVKSVV